MAISTQTEALIELYTQKISLDNKQLSQINLVQEGYNIITGPENKDKLRIWGPTEVISDYNFPIKKLDNRIVELTTQVSNIQAQILSIGQQANSVGCGTTGIDPDTVGFNTVTVYQDRINYKGYTFEGVNPYSPIGGSLTSGTSGIGTHDYVTQVAIGSYFGPINVCNNIITCTNQQCANYAATIVNLTNQLAPLQTERNGLIQKVNFLKEGRSQYELQNYGYEQSKVQLNASIGISSSIVSFLQDPNNAEWL